MDRLCDQKSRDAALMGREKPSAGNAATVTLFKNWSGSLGYAGDIRSGDKLASRFSLSVQTGF